MTEPFQFPFYGKLTKKLISKEELLSTWQRALNKGNVGIDEGVKVTGIEGMTAPSACRRTGVRWTRAR